MVLRVAPGDEIERYILIRNINDVSVNIDLSVSGDLAENIKLKENSFKLQAGEERKAYFSLTADKAGRTETKINIAFRPEEGSSVGLTAAIIVISDEKYSGQEYSEEGNEENYEEGAIDSKDKTGPFPKIDANDISFREINLLSPNLLVVSTFILAAALIILYFYSLATKYKKRGKEKNA